MIGVCQPSFLCPLTFLSFARLGILAAGSEACVLESHSVVAFIQLVRCIRESCQDLSYCGLRSESDCNSAFTGSGLFGIDIISPVAPGVMLWQICPRLCRRCGSDTPGTDALGNPCEAGWSYMEGSCFKFFTREAEQPQVSWHSAEESCREVGAHLASADTPAKNHAVFETIRNDPRSRQGFLGWKAWIGLRTEPGRCSRSADDWHWVASGEPLRFANWGNSDTRQSNKSPDCCCSTKDDEFCALVNSPFENFRWDNRHCSKLLASWVCERPSRFREIVEGTCDDHGLSTILDEVVCEVAARRLLLTDKIAWNMQDSLAPEGCSFHMYSQFGLTVASAPDNRGRPMNRSLQTARFMICGQHKQQQQQQQQLQNQDEGTKTRNTTVTPSPTVVAAEERKESFSGSWVGHVCNGAAWLLVVLTAFILRRSWYRPALMLAHRAKQMVARPLCGLRKPTVSREDPWIAGVVLQRRHDLTRLAAVCLLIVDLWHLTATAFVVDRMCPSIANLETNTQLVLLHIASVMAVLSFLLAAHRTKGPKAMTCFVVGELCLRFARTAVLREQSLLSSTRRVEEIIWRVILGLGCPPVSMAIVNACFSGCVAVLYSQVVADDMIITVTSASGILVSGDCIRLWSPDEVRAVVKTSQTLEALGSAWQGTNTTIYPNFAPLLETIAQQSTSLSAFLLKEALICAVVLFVVAAVGGLLAKDATSSARQQGTEQVSKAVSRILANLCDCVVHLDEDLNMAAPAPRLASLLMLGRQDMSGSAFKERLGAGELKHFEAALRSERDVTPSALGAGDAQMISFKDAMGISVACQVFHTTFVNPSGKQFYMLGINEVGERLRPEMEPAWRSEVAPVPAAAAAAAAAAKASAAAAAAALAAAAADWAVELSSECSESSEGRSTSGGVEEPELLLLLDFLGEDTRIRYSSPAAQRLLGIKKPGSMLVDVLEDPKAFLTIVRTVCDDILTGRVTLPHRFSLGVLPLKGKKRRRSKYRVEASLLFPEPPENESDDILISMWLNRIPSAPKGSPTLGGESGSLQPLPDFWGIRAARMWLQCNVLAQHQAEPDLSFLSTYETTPILKCG
eukprot:CAMPEP_0203851848 /NCGR_PEP_ID=MMETSP0359-20131031/7577_1 /ASSEMBLY_ACC=CAM_ASM_000338 /TAXON_ID=268821 /ORGANISM="Scrippsiella Hangoei, Strain SHTV-5" /LENGTH=1081 /DNA_ID=CAMNT_0050767907 /DNA_START=58 /DNA_END=3304 /DNA_ORIENTATION=-